VLKILRTQVQVFRLRMALRAALHLEAGPIPLEANCMKFQRFMGWRPVSTTHYNKIITWANFSICKGLRVKKLDQFNKSSIILGGALYIMFENHVRS
jgi:hypothetical protein